MGQSKLPAQCSECGLVGPLRVRAAKEGWVRRHGRNPDWLCPEHGEVWEREEGTRLQKGYEERCIRNARLLRKIPMLGAALPMLASMSMGSSGRKRR